jgi:hypothetical protein
LIRHAERAVRWAIRRWAADDPFRAVVLLLVVEVLLGAHYRIFGRYGVVAVLIGLALASVRRLPGSRAFRRVASRRWTAVALVGAVALLVSVGLSIRRMPLAWCMDEFSYLLAADTFASGRLTNPTHPMWEHFESFHIIHQPTYASKYPPGQGLALAAGQVLTGLPIVGVWASFALACAATCWMLQGWTRLRWALLGGLLAALHPNFHGGAGRPGGINGFSWSQSYMGGAVAMLGGALLYGALARALRRPRAAYGVVMGLGLTVLANSRPFEGLVASVPVGVLLLYRLLRPGPWSARALAVRVLAPMAVVLGLGAAAMGYYNWRVTGRPLSMPYVVHEKTYAAEPTPFWAAYNPAPQYHHEVMRAVFAGRDRAAVERGVVWFFRFYSRELKRALLGFYVGPFLMPLLMLPVVLRRSGPMRFAALTCLLVFATWLTALGIWPHYVAPAVALYLLLVVEGFRNLRVLRLFGLRVGRAAAIVALAFVVLSTALVMVYGVANWGGRRPLEKERLEAQLESAGGKHLVIVRYWPTEFGLRLMSWGDGTGVPSSAKNLVIVGIDNNDRLHVRIFDQDGHRVTDIDETKLTAAQARAILPLKQRLPGLLPPHEMTYVEEAEVLWDAKFIGGQSGPTHDPIMNEWVYNRADIDGAKVIWAREMGPERDAELLSYFRDRQAWLLEADATPPKLVPVDEHGSSAAGLTGSAK